MADLNPVNLPNPPPIVDPNAPRPTVPPSWVPPLSVAMEFTNFLWAAGYRQQAAAYWNAYCVAAGLLDKLVLR